ncbi:hypothetical protein Pan44_32490 [Caulifigura coniformis]|uniref:Carboxypeptidase regulatory-like domain-containing protein n=1 Tax=Caulifigura coniformis TaxID=2527983 RepID=A0A517SGJ3_9PLAN|nr:hypothetical protein [Caulifigura coniformis]QDT55207.1 hypothetical protein Pan44_32490 [Caulifigura coniformis]
MNVQNVASWFRGGLLLTAFGIAGCGGGGPEGPPLAKVTGVVTFEGQPLPDGEIIVRAADGSHAAGSHVQEGKFELNATEGKKVVEVTAWREVPGKFREDNPGEKTAVREQYIPRQFNEQTKLELEVKLPETLDVKLDLKK